MGDANPTPAKPPKATKPAPDGEHRFDDLLLDRIDALRVLRADTAEEKGRSSNRSPGAASPSRTSSKSSPRCGRCGARIASRRLIGWRCDRSSRIRLSTEQPIKALYETVGACGNPPKDDSYNFAVIAIVLLVVAWIVIPAGLWIVITKQH
jgi:hypothetical protein